MSQHYNQPNDFQYDHFGNEKPHKEKFIAIILVLIGILGLYSIIDFTNTKKSHTVWQADDNTAVTSYSEKPVEKTNRRSYKNALTKNQLLIEGYKEAEETITFTLDSYDEKATYYLDLGNGKIKEVKDKMITYKYQKPGDYTVKLKVSYQGQTKLLHKEKIRIDEAIEISGPAMSVDF